MALAAAQVIDALAARLVPLTATAGRVYTSRAWPLDEASLPAWRVVAADEAVERITLDSTLHRHLLDVRATAYTSALADLDDALHALAASALALLFATPVPYALELTAIERELTTEGEAKVGAITLTLRAEFYAEAAAPQTILS